MPSQPFKSRVCVGESDIFPCLMLSNFHLFPNVYLRFLFGISHSYVTADWPHRLQFMQCCSCETCVGWRLVYSVLFWVCSYRRRPLTLGKARGRMMGSATSLSLSPSISLCFLSSVMPLCLRIFALFCLPSMLWIFVSAIQSWFLFFVFLAS